MTTTAEGEKNRIHKSDLTMIGPAHNLCGDVYDVQPMFKIYTQLQCHKTHSQCNLKKKKCSFQILHPHTLQRLVFPPSCDLCTTDGNFYLLLQNHFHHYKRCRNMLKVCRASITLRDYGEHLISFTLISPRKDFYRAAKYLSTLYIFVCRQYPRCI